MSPVLQRLRSHGGILSAARLSELGCSVSDIREAVRAGAVMRIRNGWFALPGAEPDSVRAVRVGGTATAATVARMHRLWMHDDDRLHVRVRYSTGRLASPADRRTTLDRESHRVCVHYSRRGGLDRARDPLTTAIAEMFSCAPADDVLATVDSALECGELQMGHIGLIREHLPRSRRTLLDRVDPDAQSGLETRVRLLLRARRIPHRSQARIAGAGNVDLLVGDRLVIEVDGRSFHTGAAFENDRRRDFELVMRGYLVLRLSYRQVIDEWHRTKAGILELVARGEHRWSGRGPHEPTLLLQNA
ncbi:DUF559 domain-containing protein [Agromyces marinus]|uniref:DUF559 domain-containing protein n=1 Tax=Agromyces marinus TaxID=1389020 RepID=A0ABN6YAE6_9MICO|nr:DUF559 domain-containing protein [Agromyces marinus]UIP57520.1 hypothetical protein DSM26151_03820 [Agromyces marinus]BDZ54342.1 hypothetical protein GCM10025870_14150 [Agromyces marinus]